MGKLPRCGRRQTRAEPVKVEPPGKIRVTFEDVFSFCTTLISFASVAVQSVTRPLLKISSANCLNMIHSYSSMAWRVCSLCTQTIVVNIMKFCRLLNRRKQMRPMKNISSCFAASMDWTSLRSNEKMRIVLKRMRPKLIKTMAKKSQYSKLVFLRWG